MDSPQRLRDLAISDTGFVFDPHSGTTMSLNATGVAVLRALVGGQPRAAILDDLRERFEVGDRDLERDLDEFLLVLRQQGLVPEDFQP